MPIRAASARPSSLTLAKSEACDGQRRIASGASQALAPSVPGLMPTVTLPWPPARCAPPGMPAAPKTQPRTPRERPKANAPTAPSPGLAPANSINARAAWGLKPDVREQRRVDCAASG